MATLCLGLSSLLGLLALFALLSHDLFLHSHSSLQVMSVELMVSAIAATIAPITIFLDGWTIVFLNGERRPVKSKPQASCGGFLLPIVMWSDLMAKRTVHEAELNIASHSLLARARSILSFVDSLPLLLFDHVNLCHCDCMSLSPQISTACLKALICL